MYKFKRIFAIFLSVLLLSLTVGDAFIATNDIRRVQATGVEVVAGAAAAESILEFIIALLASIGMGEVAVLYKEAVMQGFVDYMATPGLVDQVLSENAIRLYMSAAPVANTVQSILWDDFLESLENYHDSAVDTLTGIYAQYCPELIGIAKDFVADVAAKNITIAGVTDSFSTPMTAETVAKQWSGETFHYSAVLDDSFSIIDGSYKGVHVSQRGILTVDHTLPHCGIFQVINNNYSFSVYILDTNGNIVSAKMDYDFVCYNDGELVQHNIYSDCAGINFLWDKIHSPHNVSYSVNFPVFSSRIDAEAYLKGTGAVTNALNYSTDITDNIIDNNDLPTLGDFAGELWERVANAPDCGIGAYGSGAIVSDWADDIPWLGLDDLQSFVDSIQDVFDKTIEGILDGTYDLPLDIPDYTYGDAWIDAVDRTWDDVIDNPVNNPAIDKPDNPAVGDKDDPITSDKDTTISIDIPADDFVPTINDSFGDIAGNLRYKFPFSIPWDIRHVFQVLADTPKAPRFELPLVIKRFGIDERIIVDMAMFQVLSNLSRSLFSMLFGMYLMNLTFKVVSMRKEE